MEVPTNSLRNRAHSGASYCETCSAGVYCENLKNAICIMKRKIDNEPLSEDELNQFYKTLLELESKGWEYPNNQSSCALEHPENEIKGMIDRIARMLR